MAEHTRTTPQTDVQELEELRDQTMCLPNSPRSRLLAECSAILTELHNTLVERDGNYADIRDNSRTFGEIVEALGLLRPTNTAWSATQVHCISNIVTKLARLSTGDTSHQDSWLDIAGYAILALAATRLAQRAP